MRGAVRLSALMDVPVTFVWTHDSIGLGEDGPTHQPIEHLWSLRALPRISIIRPADANETASAWRAVLHQRGPAGLILTRQNVPTLDRAVCAPADGLRRGAYVLLDAAGDLGPARFIANDPPDLLRPWDGRHRGTYQPAR